MTFVHIGVFIMAVAFAIVAVFIAKLLLRISGVIGTIGQTVSNMESKLDKTVIELEQTITETNVTATDIEEKSLALNSIFYTVKHVGDSTSLISNGVAARTKRYSEDSSMPGTKPFVRIIQFSEFASGLFNSWKRGKSASSKQF
ncbi:DUF948 domain-containing protein [Sporosarcina sp. JAI121]|uniref:DUF948 domain-containing protein n=1 Tax=Sporosarcina sp. JAI121 TaxID=2723064 RepID=UPI0015C88328|nr:DUF948 domain-containing protein [Sporosarcina sp. JAI121]NYF25446.1 uncharacterized protein YoxC [Sporosarcina sp. JAI121]